jgi:glycosyltransferase involved in cell wall biosynthesis
VTVKVQSVITSVPRDRAGAATLLRWVRGHWGIENRLHYVRDVTMGEDASRARSGSGPQVLAALRNVAISPHRSDGATNIAAGLRRNAARVRDLLVRLRILLKTLIDPARRGPRWLWDGAKGLYWTTIDGRRSGGRDRSDDRARPGRVRRVLWLDDGAGCTPRSGGAMIPPGLRFNAGGGSTVAHGIRHAPGRTPATESPREAEKPPRVLIVTGNASERMGGEAVLPLEYFRRLRRRGVEAWMVAHERNRQELEALFPSEQDRLVYLPDLEIHGLACRMGPGVLSRIGQMGLYYIAALATQLGARRAARRLVAERGITVVHQPIPVSPREVSMLFGVGAPVIIGPMNGGMTYPAAFRSLQRASVRRLVRLGRWMAELANVLMPGKYLAAALLVANRRTRESLPWFSSSRVIDLVENAVDLDDRPTTGPAGARERRRIVFAGRLIDWKGVDLLLEAFGTVHAEFPDAALDIVGDGPERARLEAQVGRLGLADSVTLLGWRSRAEVHALMGRAEVFVLPSLYECGGNVVLEAMAAGVPVVATRWGGPAEYLSDRCGLLVDPDSRDGFISGLARAIGQLLESPDLRAELVRNGRLRVEREYTWDAKIDRILEVYRQVALV